MILYVMTVRDRSADVFGQPSFHLSQGGAARAFADEVNRAAPDNVMYRHPEDFDLFLLGSYDDSTAAFDMAPVPKQIAVGKDIALLRKA